jgi:hypothetical protein
MVYAQSRNLLSYTASILSATLVLSAAAPATSVFADETNTYQVGQVVNGTGTTTTVLGDSSSSDVSWPDIDFNNPVLGGSLVTEEDLPEFTYTKSTDSYDEIYARLSDTDKATFNEIVFENQLSATEQLDLLQTWDGMAAQPRWKTSVLKLLVGAALSAAGISNSATASKMLKAINSSQTNIEKSLENALVKYANVNRSVAKKAAKTAVFLIL